MIVVKVGGSLFDLPDLGRRLLRWLETLPTAEIVLFPGGGAAVDWLRQIDRCQGLGDEKAHWLAIRTLDVNAQLLADLVNNAAVIEELTDCPPLWSMRRIPVLAPWRFTIADEARPGKLPHSWAVTSDSLAARLADLWQADELILLKSCGASWGADGTAIDDSAVVDEYFTTALERIERDRGRPLPCRMVNFRVWPD